MKYFKKLMLVVLLSNMMIFAEDEFVSEENLIKKYATSYSASSAFSSHQFPVLFVDISFSYGPPIVGMFYFMYTVVTESFYERVMSFGFGVSAAKMKRNEAVLSLSDLDTNVLTLTLPEDCSRQPTLSPCFFIGSPPLSPFSSPQCPAVRKRAPSNHYMANVDLF